MHTKENVFSLIYTVKTSSNRVVKADGNDHIKIPNLALGPKAHLINCSFFRKNQD